MKERFIDGAYDGALASTEEIEAARIEYWENHKISSDYDKKKQHEKNIILDFLNKNKSNAILLKDEKLIKFDGKKLTVPKIKK